MITNTRLYSINGVYNNMLCMGNIVEDTLLSIKLDSIRVEMIFIHLIPSC